MPCLTCFLGKRPAKGFEKTADGLYRTTDSSPWSQDIEALREWTPPPGHNHLSLGITIEGIRSFLSEIGWPESFIRDRHEKMHWCNDAFGSQYHKGNGGTNLRGYDLGFAVRLFLQGRRKPLYAADDQDYAEFQELGAMDKSICEFLLARGSECVSTANVFYSHIQRKTIERTLECMEAARAAHRTALPEGELYFWLDYFVLRQCMQDFELPKIQQAIADIGCTVVELDNEPHAYLSRSFCVLEVYATVNSGARLLIQTDYVRAARMQSLLDSKPVQSQAASSWDTEAKVVIDAFIEQTIGFAQMDEIVTKAMIGGAKKVMQSAHEEASSLTLQGIGLGPNDLPELTQLLHLSTTLKEVNLLHNQFDSPSASALVAAAKKGGVISLIGPALTDSVYDGSVYLSGQPADVILLAGSADSLLHGVKQLCLNGCNLGGMAGEPGLGALLDTLDRGACPALETLALARNKIGDTDVRTLVNMGMANGALASLKRLYLANDCITDDGYRTLADALSKGALPALENIDVAHKQRRHRQLVAACRQCGIAINDR